MTGLDGATLSPAAVAAVARGGEQVELSADGRARNLAARETIAQRLRIGRALYGATTGVGALRDRVITEAEREDYQWNLLRSHAVSAGRRFAVDVVRAGMVVRANQLGAGGAGVAPPLLEGLIAALNAGITPFTRQLGSRRNREPAALTADAPGV